jgi:hypothetical protein
MHNKMANETNVSERGGVVGNFAAVGTLESGINFIGDDRRTRISVNSSTYGVGSLSFASGTSSDAGSFFFQTNYKLDLQGLLPQSHFIKGARGPLFPVYPVIDKNNPQENLLMQSDGGYSSYTPVASLIARGVTKIVAFVNSYTPLANATQYNPVKQGYVTDLISSSFAAWFGFKTADYYESATHIFPQDQFVGLVKKMQASQAAGNGAFVRAQLTTIANVQFAVPAGLKVDIAFFLTSSSSKFISRLPLDVQADIALGDAGPYPKFPYTSTEIAYTKKQANLLVALSSFLVRQNLDKIKDMFD